MTSLLQLMFAWQIEPGLLLYGTYNPWLVTLSIGVAIFSSTMGLHAAAQARSSPDARSMRLLLAASSVSLGCGVWAMHFIGMLAFDLCIPTHYDRGPTFASIVPAIAASALALQLLRRERLTRSQLWAGGALLGAGIGAMHYMGMAALHVAAVLRYDPGRFVVSLVVAIGLSVASLWIHHDLETRWQVARWRRTLTAGTLMGLAIAGMHYTGMSAARFIGQRGEQSSASWVDPQPLAFSITLATVLATVVTAAATGWMRYRQLWQTLQTQSAQARAVFETSIDGMLILDARGHVLDVNASGEHICRRRRDDMIGQPVARILPPAARQLAERDFEAWIRALPLGTAQDTWLPTLEGATDPDSGTPIRLVIERTKQAGPLLYVVSFSDIGEQKAMEKALRHSERQFRSLIDNIPGISFRCEATPDWRLLFISEAVEPLTGYRTADFLGEAPVVHLIDLVHRADVPRLHERIERARNTQQSFVQEFQLHHRDGSTRWMWCCARGLSDDAGSPQWIDGVLLDISARRQMEEALREAKQRAEEAVQVRTAFMANMSHEIRTPMNAIIGFTEVVLGGPALPPESRRHLETVRNSARSLLILLNDILDTSKLERGAVELESLPYDLPPLLQQVLDEQALQARKKGLGLLLDWDPTLPSVLMGDAHRLRQVLLNLVGNAVKFTERGQVRLRARADGQTLQLSVRDTGIGIAPERLARIFDPFTQADASMSRRYGGTGLGTTISRQLVELMGGTIQVESTPGRGSTFTVRLPLTTAPPGRLPEMAVQVRHRLPPLRILVVDDVAENRDLLNVLLGRDGHQVCEAENGQVALQCCEQQTFDLVLMDLQMPVMDGLQACRALRETEARLGQPRTPVIALSASVFLEDRHQALDAGMDGFAFKPVDHATLMLEMARVTGHATTVPDALHADLPDAAPATTEAPASLSSLALIDPSAGPLRWGEVDAWLKALEQFAQAKQTWLDEQQADRLPSTEAAANAGHRLKGVAANLGLPALQAAGAQLEQAARQAPPDHAVPTWSPEWALTLQILRDTLGAVRAHTSASGPVSDTPAPARAGAATAVSAPLAPSARPVLPAQDREQLEHDLAELTRACRRGEHLEAVLDDLNRRGAGWLSLDALSGLQQALDEFDFDGATRHLDTLKQGLAEPSPDEHAHHPPADTVDR